MTSCSRSSANGTKAENDLKNAGHTLKLGTKCPTDTVCFHAQQYMKALLVSEGVDFPKSHDLGKLTALLPVRARLSLTSQEQGKLSEYAAGPRYPGWGPISLAEARHAVALARRVRREARGLLPREALRRRTP